MKKSSQVHSFVSSNTAENTTLVDNHLDKPGDHHIVPSKNHNHLHLSDQLDTKCIQSQSFLGIQDHHSAAYLSYK